MIRQVREFVRKLALGIERVVRQPRSELDRWGRSVRFAYDLSRVGALQLKNDRAPEMAAALAFRTLFALAPVLVVVTIVVRAVAGVEEFLGVVEPLLDAAGLSNVQIVFPATGDAENAMHTESLKTWLATIVEQTTHVTLPAVGWIGFVMIVYAAISLLRTIESSCNTIYHAPHSRPWTRSVPLYWFLLTVSPLALSLASWLHGQVATWGAAVAWSGWMVASIGIAWNLLVTWSLLTLAFVLVPNAPVATRPAAAGALVSVLLLELGKRTIGQYLASSFGMTQLVTSLGLIPLFMFWVYLMWLAVLFGLEVSAILQQLGSRNLEEMERATDSIGFADPSVVVTVMVHVAREFRAGRSSAVSRIAAETRLSERQIGLLVQRLIAAELLHRVDDADTTVCLARPPEEIAASQLLEIGFALSDAGSGSDGSPIVARLRAAQQVLAADWTLGMIVAE